MTATPDVLASFARSQLAALADARKAREMAAYMKTDMPFYGVQRPQRAVIERQIGVRH